MQSILGIGVALRFSFFFRFYVRRLYSIYCASLFFNMYTFFSVIFDSPAFSLFCSVQFALIKSFGVGPKYLKIVAYVAH